MTLARFAALIFTMLSIATAAGAQPLPALFDVSGVASDDVLNIRAQPSASAEKIGALAHDATGVEVVAVSENGRWGLVNVEGRSGWVSLHFLRRDPEAGRNLPAGLACSGTEPFWALAFSSDGTALAQWLMLGLPGDSSAIYDGYWSSPPVNRGPDPVAFALLREMTATGVGATGIIRREYCDDGMSDQTYGLSINMVLTGQERLFVDGCCSLSAG